MVWSQLGTAVLGGTVGAALTQAATFLRDWLNKKEDGTFTALMLALALEDYASECTEPIFTYSNWDGSGRMQEPSGSIPALPEFPEKTNWRSIGVDHASDVLGFRVKVSSAQSSLRTTWEHEGPISTYGEASDSGTELGAAALVVARKLRSAFKLPPSPTQGAFDANAFFTEKLAALQLRREDYAKSIAAMGTGLQPVVTPTTEDEPKPPPPEAL